MDLLRINFLWKIADISEIFMRLVNAYLTDPALSSRGNLAHARARAVGSPRTVEH